MLDILSKFIIYTLCMAFFCPCNNTHQIFPQTYLSAYHQQHHQLSSIHFTFSTLMFKINGQRISILNKMKFYYHPLSVTFHVMAPGKWTELYFTAV